MGRRVKSGYAAALLLFVGAFVLTLAAFSLTACEPMGIRGVVEDLVRGEGDGLAPDTTPPAVESTTPADGANDVPLDVQIEVVFSEAMNPDSITAENITLTTGGSGVPRSVAYDDTAQTATLTPDSSLSPLTVYRVKVTTGVTDAAGNGLAEDYIFEFTTTDIASSWAGEEIIYANIGQYPQIAINDSGQGFAVWFDNLNVYSKRYIPGSGWTASPDTLGGSGGVEAHPKIAADTDGNAIAAWLYESGGDYYVQGRRFISNSWEGSGEQISSQNTTEPLYIDVTMGSGANGFAVWERNNLSYSNKHTSDPWDASEHEHDANSDLEPAIAMSADNTAIIIALEGTNKIKYTWYNGSGWPGSSPEYSGMLSTAYTFKVPRIAMDADGRALALFAEEDVNGNYEVKSIGFDGMSWGTVFTISSSMSSIPGSPSIEMSPNGKAAAVWVDAGSGEIYANIYSGGWVGPELIGNGSDPACGIDDSGNAFVVFDRGSSIFAREYKAASGWQIGLRISDAATGPGYPDVAVNKSGDVIAVWVDAGTIYANRVE